MTNYIDGPRNKAALLDYTILVKALRIALNERWRFEVVPLRWITTVVIRETPGYSDHVYSIPYVSPFDAANTRKLVDSVVAGWKSRRIAKRETKCQETQRYLERENAFLREENENLQDLNIRHGLAALESERQAIVRRKAHQNMIRDIRSLATNSDLSYAARIDAINEYLDAN